MDHTIAGFPVVVAVPVWWGDQDALGHVNNTVFLRWFESARIAYCDRVGLEGPSENTQIGPILASITCNFRRQVAFPDSVLVGARVTRIGRSSLEIEHIVVSESQSATAAEGSSVVVAFDYSANRSHPVPAPVRQAIEALEGKSFESPADSRPT